jgi:hypothetical protein
MVSAVSFTIAGVVEEQVWVCGIVPLKLWVEVVEGMGGIGVAAAEGLEE